VTEPAAASPARTPSLWEDFIDIFVSPSAVFARRERSGFGVALLVLTVLFALIAIGTRPLVQPALDAEFARGAARAMAANPALTPEKMQQGRAISEKVGMVFIVFFVPVAAMLTGLVLWLVGKLFDSTQTVKTATMVATYAFFPKLLAALTAAGIAYFSDPARLNGMARLTAGAGALFDPDTASPVLLAMLSRLDVFTIWSTVLLAIGLHITGRVPRAQAYAAAAIVWLIGALPGLLGALRS
jgi:hypothetical protein